LVYTTAFHAITLVLKSSKLGSKVQRFIYFHTQRKVNYILQELIMECRGCKRKPYGLNEALATL
jgi:hypothetical protein